MPLLQDRPSLSERLRTLLIGRARSPHDSAIFHKLSLVAFFAWVGLGADGLSSSCYGPEQAFLALREHTYLGILVALASGMTIFVISASYSQIIELFPTGGGGYLVASKLLSPTLGMISGCALLIDYVLTITISVASGADAVFSFLPAEWRSQKLTFAIVGVILLIILNMRGVKESVLPLTPIFLIFVATHAFAILYALIVHLLDFPAVTAATMADVRDAHTEIGLIGMMVLLLRAYSLGAGTYTGIEAVSNGLPILRDPKVQTGKHTMRYMAISLAFTVLGLMFAYVLYHVQPQAGKTLNAVLFERITADWNWGYSFVLVTLISEAAILFIAAQTGFLDGPRVLSNMALDRWLPTKFATLSDRLVTQNGILLMGGSALVLMVLARGSVEFLVVLYSINVFITFVLSQLGMVRHWWRCRFEAAHWRKKILINGFGLLLTAFILISVTVVKFNEGGWITLLVTGSVAAGVIYIKRHYNDTARLLRRLDNLVTVAEHANTEMIPHSGTQHEKFDANAKTAVLLVNGFSGLGLHTLFNVFRLFEGTFKNFVFVQIGIVDAGNFKGDAEIEHLRDKVKNELNRYVEFMQQNDYHAEAHSAVGIDVIDEVAAIATKILQRFPHAIFFGGQLVFPRQSLLSRWLHNYTAFEMQRRFYQQGIPLVILPVRV